MHCGVTKCGVVEQNCYEGQEDVHVMLFEPSETDALKLEQSIVLSISSQDFIKTTLSVKDGTINLTEDIYEQIFNNNEDADSDEDEDDRNRQ